MTTTKLTIASLITLTLAASACQPAAENNSQSKELKTLTAKIEAMDKKLDRLGTGLARGKAPPPKRPTVGQLYKVGVSPDDAYRGGRNAKVTLVVASEFACPYCKLLATAIDPLLESYDDDELRVVSKQFVVHPSIATEPALAACAANKQGKFAPFEKALWAASWKGEERPSLMREGLSKASLHTIAEDIGLDMKRFVDDTGTSCKQTIARNRKEMSTLGVSGTPAVYINGRYYGGPRTTEALKDAVDKELATASAQLAKGGSLEDYYDGLIARGKARL